MWLTFSQDLIKSSEGCEGYSELLEALECMLVVLRCVNDGMHQLAITGYPVRQFNIFFVLTPAN